MILSDVSRYLNLTDVCTEIYKHNVKNQTTTSQCYYDTWPLVWAFEKASQTTNWKQRFWAYYQLGMNNNNTKKSGHYKHLHQKHILNLKYEQYQLFFFIYMNLSVELGPCLNQHLMKSLQVKRKSRSDGRMGSDVCLMGNMWKREKMSDMERKEKERKWEMRDYERSGVESTGKQKKKWDREKRQGEHVYWH